MFYRWMKALGIFVFLIVLSSPVSLYAQNVTGTITGTVKDEAGGVVPGVEVRVVNVETGQARTLLSNDAGHYVAALLPTGQYQLSIEQEGFKTLRSSIIEVRVDEVIRLDLRLEIGSVTEEITVEANAILMDLETSDIGELIDNKRVENLPLNGRQFIQLAALQPGAGEVLGGGTGGSLGATNGPLLVLNGQLMQNNKYSIDGTTATDTFYNTLSISPSVDAIQEFKILTGNYSAEYGGFTGAFVNISIKSGTNAFHGSVYEFHRNDNLDARNFFDVGGPGEFKQNQYGAAIGGPILRNKAFFFFNWEGLRSNKAVTQQFTVPTEKMRAGDLSELPALLPSAPIPTDPETGLPFPDNRIPSNRITRVAPALFALMPLPNSATSPLVAVVSDPLERTEDQINFRIDYQISEKDSIFGRYSWGEIEITSPAMAPEFGAINTNFGKNLAIGYTRVASPTILNEFRFGYNRGTGGQDTRSKVDFAGATGLEGVTRDPELAGVPGFNFSAGGGFSAVGAPSVRVRRNSDDLQFTDNLIWTRGNHGLKFGVNLIRHNFKPVVDLWKRGSYTYNGSWTGQGDPSAGLGLADFLIGRPFFGFFGSGDGNLNARNYEFGAYIQDDWSVSSNLTLNLGLRWEYYSPVGDVRHEQVQTIFRDPAEPWTVVPADIDRSLLVTPLNLPLFTNEEVGLPTALINPFYKQFAPRLGFAYTPFGDQKTVLHGGYGIYWANYAMNKPAHMHFAPPLFDLRRTLNLFPSGSLTDITFFAGVSGGATLYPLDENYRPGYVQQWSFGIQRQLSDNTVFEINYIGNKGTHLERNHDFNQARLDRPGETTPVASRRRYPQLAAFQLWSVSGNSNYNALTLRLERRFSSGLAFTGAYTWAKGTDDGLSEGSNNTGGFAMQDFYNRSNEKGLNPSDHEHRFVFHYVYDLPFGASLSGIPRAILHGWSINGIVTISDGLPLGIIAGVDTSNTQGSGTRPNRICDGTLSNPTVEKWFDTSCFVLAPFGAFGDSGRNPGVRIPGTANVDFATKKTFFITERHQLEFRAEFFNIFNRAPLGIPGRSVASGTFGRIFSAGDAREIQFALRYSF